MRLSNDVLHPPSVSGIVFIVVLTTPKSETASQNNDGEGDGGGTTKADDQLTAAGGSSDTYKRKLEDEDGPRASKNPRSHSPDNYVRMKLIHVMLCRTSQPVVVIVCAVMHL